MTFQHPEFLYYMLVPLFILFGFLLTQKEAEATFFSPEVIDKLRVSANTLTLQARNALFMLMAFFIIVALAGPVIPDGEVEVKAKSADIMIALDISDSMLAQDVYPNRLKSAKQKAMQFLKLAPNERMGVIAFAKNSYLVSPLSFDHNAVGFLLRQLSTDFITEKGTNLMSMLQVVDTSIKKDSKKYLLILSDGGDTHDFSEEIDFAKEKNIAIFILGIGTTKGAPIKMENGEFIKKDGKIIVTKLNENIADLATKTGGVYIENVKSDEDIKVMLQEIESHSKKKELKSQKIERFIPLFYFPLGFALVLLLIATSSMSKRENISLPSAFLLFTLLFTNQSLEAGVLDFMELDKAKKAYEKGEYETSQKLYTKYAQGTHNAQSLYNAGNAFYKQKKYDEAIKLYERSSFTENTLQAKNDANMGNAYAKKGDLKSLEKAVEAYEKSLKLQEDKQTRENLEVVKKAIKQQKQKKEQKNKQQKKQDKKKRQDKKQQKKQENKKESKEKTTQDKKEKEAKKKSKQKKENTKKKDEVLKPQKNKMSDAEEKKWLQQLNKQQNTYMYKLNKTNKMKENTDEMPW